MRDEVRRVLVIVPGTVKGAQLGLREIQSGAASIGADIEFIYRPVRASAENQVSHHDYALSDICVLEAGLAAQEEGFDAVCVDTVSDAGVDALRSVLEIPVIGPGRASYLMALMLGNRFSIVTMWDRWKPLYLKSLAILGLEDRCASIRAIGVTPDSRNLLVGKEEEVFPLLFDAATSCVVDDGADVICLGSTTMHQAGTYLAARLQVPVINPGPLSYKLAEAVLGLAAR